jgi:hypothetical protein
VRLLAETNPIETSIVIWADCHKIEMLLIKKKKKLAQLKVCIGALLLQFGLLCILQKINLQAKLECQIPQILRAVPDN